MHIAGYSTNSIFNYYSYLISEKFASVVLLINNIECLIKIKVIEKTLLIQYF